MTSEKLRAFLESPRGQALRAESDAAMAAALKAGTNMGTTKKKTNGKGGKIREGVTRKEYMADLPVEISEDEAMKCGHRMCGEIRKLEELEEERRDAMADFRSRMNAIRERSKELATSFEEHTKKVPVKVREILILETNEIQVIRLDTGVLVETRTAEAEERQEALFPDGKPADVENDDEAEADA